MPFAFLKDSFESWCTHRLYVFARWYTSCFNLAFSQDSLVSFTVRGKSWVKVAGVQMITYIGNIFVQIMSFDFTAQRIGVGEK